MPTKKEKNKRSIVLGDENQENLGSTPAKAWFLGIGIDDYEEFPKLNNAVKDVEDVMKVLIQKYDLEEENAFLLLNEKATEDNIIDKLDYFSKNLSNADKLMIYYSGHGHLDRTTGLGFWIPQDAIQGKTARYIRNSTIRDYINVIKTRHTLLISDSCFSGSLFVRGASRATSSAIEELESLESRWGICSGRADEEVNDGPPGGNSPFAQSIIDSLKRNQQKFLNVAKLADKVILQTRSNYEQLPEGNPMYGVGHKGGQYIFRLKANEKEAWAACQAEGTLMAYQLFVQNYPDGKNAAEAKAELNFLKEEEAWATAQTKNTISAYTHYDQQFPNGRYARQSLMAIAELEDEQSWAEASRRNNITAYKEYLLEHPDGDYVAQANANLKELLSGRKTKKSTNKIAVDSSVVELEAKKVETDPEQAAWNKAKSLDTEEAYNQFYLRFPHGKFRNEVRAALNRLKEGAAITKIKSPIQAKRVQEKTVNSGGLSKEKKIGIGVGAVLLPLLIWGMIALFGGSDRPEPEFTEAQIMQMMQTRGFDVGQLSIELDGDRLIIFGTITSEEEKQKVNDYLLNNFDDIASVNDSKLEVIPGVIPSDNEPNNSGDNDPDEGSDGQDEGLGSTNDEDEANPQSPSVAPPQISITEREDRILVKIFNGKEPYKLQLRKDEQKKYGKDIDIAGVYTIYLKDYQKEPGTYLVHVEDANGGEAKMDIDIIGITNVDKSSRALNFDGKNDYITFKNPKNIPTGNSPYTIEAWVYANKMGTLGIVGWGKYHTINKANALRLDGGGIAHYWWGNDLNVKKEDLTKDWYHIAATFDGTKRKVYLNGIVVGSDKPKGHNVPNADNLTIGKTCDNCGGEHFDGMIDEVRIWDKARNASEIQENMLRKLSGKENGLVAYYNFDQGEANGNNSSVKELKDLSGHSNHGTLNGFSLSGKTSNWTKGIDLIASNASVTLDQSQKVSGGTFGAYSRWQSFTAGQNGYLTKIAVYHYAGYQKTKLNIFEGEGKNGKLLHSQPVEADGTKVVSFQLTKGIKLEKGKKYTINFEKFAWFVSKGDAYSGGRADFNSKLDFYFETYVVPVNN